MAFARGPKITTDGLVLYLDAANKKSYPGTGTVWKDLSGHGNNATIWNGATYLNGGIQFRSGTRGFASASCTEFLDGNEESSWTIESTFKFIANSNTGEAFIVGKVGCHSGLVINTNRIGLQLRTTDCFVGGVRTTISGILVPNNWYQATMVYNRGEISCYINGVLEYSTTFDKTTYDLGPLNDTVYIGGSGHATNYSTNSDISIVRGYSKVLSEIEILQNFHATKSRFGL